MAKTPYVKMWDGKGYTSVNPKYVDEYKKKGYTTTLPSPSGNTGYVNTGSENVGGSGKYYPTVNNPNPYKKGGSGIIASQPAQQYAGTPNILTTQRIEPETDIKDYIRELQEASQQKPTSALEAAMGAKLRE